MIKLQHGDHWGRDRIPQYDAYNRASGIMEIGLGHMRSGYTDLAEKEIFKAVRMAGEAGRSNVGMACHLAELWIKMYREPEGIELLERCLPTPYAFDRLMVHFRRQMRESKKGEAVAMCATIGNQMLSLDYIRTGLIRAHGGMAGEDFESEGRDAIDRIKQQHGTIYAWRYDRDGACPDGTLMSATDYRNLHRATF